MRHFKPGLTLAGIAALLLTACGGGGGAGSSSSSSGGTTNNPPTANAGGAQTVTSGVTVTLAGSGTDSDGSIATYSWTQTVGGAVTLSASNVAQPTFTAPTVATATTLTFSLVVTDNRGASSAASTVNITVNPAVAGNVNVTGRVRYARPLFSSAGNRPLVYSNPSLMPARAVTVNVLAAGTATVLGTGSTNDSGDFSISVAGNTNVTVQFVARIQRTGALPNWDVQVKDGTAAATYTYSDNVSFNSSGGAHNVDIPMNINASGTATGTRHSGPFAALDTVYSGIQFVLTAAPTTNFPPLIIDWGSQTDGTFFDSASPQRIALLADLTEDTDEFDQHVVAHEFGHYIEDNFSRADNIGGAHGLGDRLDIRVAFGEGFGYAFAAMVLNDPDARDSFVNGTTLVSGGFNIEQNPATNPPGIGGDDVGCWCSESSVWSILYDVYDSTNDTNDTLALGFGPIWSVLTNAQRTTPAFTSIFSFITALKADQAGSANAINTLIAAQNITTTGLDAYGSSETHLATGVPSNATFPFYTDYTVGSGPIILRTVDDAGTTNTVGNHRYVRFTLNNTRNITITLSSTNPNNADPDFVVWRAGTFIRAGVDPPAATETEGPFSLGPGNYVIDAYDCANGCGPAEGTSGDYDLTLTIN